MKWIYAILTLIVTTSVSAQVATINDKDGYTNVRVEPKPDATVIHKIQDTDIFMYEEDEKSPEWVQVFIPKNKYSIGCTEPGHIVGFIHSSRLLPIEKRPKYTGKEFVFIYTLGPFSA